MAEFGYALSSEEHPPNDLVRFAQRAEEVGFTFAAISDHFHPWVDSQGQSPFVWSVIGGIAHATSTLKLGTGIVLMIQRDPIVTAREVASLDFLSGGRVEFGIGAGWNREEMANHGAEYRTRWRLMRDRVLAMKALWTNEVAEYHGEFVDFDPVWQWPKPIQKPHPPVIIGGDGPKATEALLEYGDGWIPRANRGDAPLEQRLADMTRLLAERGRGSVPTTVFGAPTEPAGLEEYRRLGVTRAVFRLPPASADEVLPVLDRYAELVRSMS